MLGRWRASLNAWVAYWIGPLFDAEFLYMLVIVLVGLLLWRLFL